MSHYVCAISNNVFHFYKNYASHFETEKAVKLLVKISAWFSVYFGKSTIFVKSSGHTAWYIPYFSIQNGFIGELLCPSFTLYMYKHSRVGLGNFTVSNLNKVNQKLRLIHRRFYILIHNGFQNIFILTTRTDIAQNEHSNKSKVIYTSTKNR